MAEPTTRPDGYQKRIVDPEIERYLNLFGAVEISGTRWCGKTWSSLAHGSSVTYVDRGANLMLVQADPSFALSGEKPHVIDEWQLVPPVWDVVRHAVDDSGGAKGLWILTGSSTPASDETQHSGAGRIGRIHMHPMALAESGESSASVSIAGLFEGRFAPCSANPDIEELAHLCVRGGWPALQGFGSSDAQEVVHSYLSDIFAQSISRMGGDPVIAERTAESVARNLAQAATLSTLARDVYAIDDNRERSRRSPDISTCLPERFFSTGLMAGSRHPGPRSVCGRSRRTTLLIHRLRWLYSACPQIRSCRTGRRLGLCSKTCACATWRFTPARSRRRGRTRCTITVMIPGLRRMP